MSVIESGRSAARWVTLALALGGAVPLTGCTLSQCPHAERVSAKPASILHLVFFQLHDPEQVDALLVDCERLLPDIPGVVSYAAGRHIDTGRPTVVDDYDLALCVGFSDEAAYRAYVEHPQHLELVAAWKPRISRLVVRDVFDRGS